MTSMTCIAFVILTGSNYPIARNGGILFHFVVVSIVDKVGKNSGLHWFCFTFFSDWSRNSRHSLNQSDSRRSPAFSRAFGSLLVFTLSSRSIFFLLAGSCYYNCFTFTTLSRKVFYPSSSKRKFKF